MPVSRDTIADVLEGAAPHVGSLIGAIGGAGVVAPIVGQALGLAADLVRSGDDAAVVIERIRRSPDLLKQVRAEARWEAKLDDRFPRESS